ncbi:MAG TPA: hypothetical protein VF720_08430 [Candidatus Eisenbacteria bacterium]
MSVDAHKPGPPASKEALAAGHEISEIQPKPILAFLILIAIFSAFCFGIIVVYFRFLAADAAKHSPRPSPLITQGSARVPPEPRLQVDAWGDWDSYKADQDRQLGHYSWANKDSLTIRMPIERAMEIVLQRGLPARAGTMPPPSPDGGEAPGHEAGGRMAPHDDLRMKPPTSRTEPAPTGAGGHR